jgi:hypothetical protein
MGAFKLFDAKGWGTFFKDKVAAGAGAAMDAGAKMLTGGLVGAESRAVDGGTKQKVGVHFGNFVKEFRRVRAECAEIEASGAFGEGVKLYNALKMLADFGLPLLRTISNSIGMWGLLLGPATGGASLGVAAGAATISLLISALKGVVELALTLWSAAKVHEHTDRDARALRTAQVERRQHGVELVKDAVTTGMMGSVAVTKGGDDLGAGKALSRRFNDFDNSKGTTFGKVDPLGVVGGSMARGAAQGALGLKSGLVGSDSAKEDSRRKARTAAVEAPASLGVSADDSFLPAAPAEEKGASPPVGRHASKVAGAMDSIASSMASTAAKATGKDDAADGASDVRAIADDFAAAAENLPG